MTTRTAKTNSRVLCFQYFSKQMFVSRTCLWHPVVSHGLPLAPVWSCDFFKHANVSKHTGARSAALWPPIACRCLPLPSQCLPKNSCNEGLRRISLVIGHTCI